MFKRSLVLIPFVLMLVLSTNVSGQATGTIMREVWEGIGGTSVSDLTNNANYPDNPTWGELVTSFETPTDFADNFGSRVHGFLHPATTGDYTFWIATDDNSDLLLSTDEDPANAVVISSVTAWAPARAFDDPDVIPSEPIHLEAGMVYYISGIYKEGGGGDNLAVAWQGPDSPDRAVIDGAFLSPAPWAPGLLKAGLPNPADGAIDADVSSLEWAKGATAVSHKVYLSTDATVDDADLLGETELLLQPVVLDPGATYYWRVDEIDADAGVIEGNVWSFSTLPLEAHFPSPPDGSTNVISAQLSWTGGKDAIMHNVYFGTDPAALLSVSQMQMDASYDAGALDPDTTYYWRIDEFTPVGTVAGPVWSFSTIGAVTPIEEPGLVLRYQFDEDASSLAALDVAGNAYHGVITGATWADGLEGGALDMAGVGYVDVPAESWSTIENQMTIALWAYGDPDLMPRNNSVFWADDGAGNRVAQAHLPWGNGSVYFDAGGAGYDRINKAASPDEYEGGWRHWTFLKNAETGDQQIYLDGSLWHSGTGATMPMTGVTAFTIGSAANHGNLYSGMIDDFRLYNTALPIEEIRVLAGVEELPYGPAPADGEIDVETAVTLTWNPALDAVEQDVYLGTDEAAVADANASDATGIYVGRQAETDSALADLGRGVTYFWKVDGVKADGTVMPGTVWNFRILDRNTDNWASAVASADPGYLDTYVQNGAYDIGTFGGEMTYEFIVNSNPDETAASMALIGRIGHGDTTVALKYEQWNNTGTYGATVFGVADHDYGVAIAPGEYTHLVFVSSEAAGTTELYVNGVLEGSIASAITLSGIVGIGQAIRDPEGAESIDNFDGDIFGVAIYDRLLTADEIVANGDKYFSPIPITDPDMLIYYDFESGEGSVALDQSGHSNHGLFVGTPEWATGPFGGAVSIVLEDVDYIETGAPLGITSNTISVTGWVKLDALPAGWSGILTTRGSGNLGLQHDGTELRYMWGADLYWSFSSGLPLPVGEWYFAALAISPDQAKLYLNGVEQTATNVAPHDPVDFDSLIRVGRDHSDDRIMTSLIDEVKLYNRTLTDVDIQKVFLSDVTAPGDVVQGVPNDGDWPGGEHPGLAIADDSGLKFLHRKGGAMATGIQVEPAVGATIVTGLTLTTANDTPARDPITFELSGSNESIDGPYELIAAGDVPDFAQAGDWPRFTTNATAISFENAAAYKYYQVLFPLLRGETQSLMQIAEVELLGVVAPLLVEDFESYAVGTDLHGVNDWEGWEGAAGAGAPVSDALAFGGLNSVEIIGTADLVKKLDVTGGLVTLTAMQYIPSGTTGDTFFILMNQYAPNPLDWSPQSKFSLGTGQINDGGGAIVYDQWVELKYVIDLDNNTVDEYYDGAVIRSGQWDNDGHNTLQAIDLYSAGASSVYYDDIVITPAQ